MKSSDQAASNIVPIRPDVQLTRTQRKIIEAKNAIYFQPQPDAHELDLDPDRWDAAQLRSRL
jgi:hypothetical protein